MLLRASYTLACTICGAGVMFRAQANASVKATERNMK